MTQVPFRASHKARLPVPTNADFAWDAFDAVWYHERNYSHLRCEDREIIESVRDFLISAAAKGLLQQGSLGVDIGSGTNVYPSLMMLPFCERIDLLDYSASNVTWLKEQVVYYEPSWDDFWAVLLERDLYCSITDPRSRLAEVACIAKDNVFELPARRWDIGTMFFVAESLTSDHGEFTAALHRFVSSLKPAAPFVMTFMRHSEGYCINDNWFPAVAIDVEDVVRCLEPLTRNLNVQEVRLRERLRPGYDGMILVTGYCAQN